MQQDDNNDIARRRSVRLAGFDYRLPGGYFVTLCAWQKQCVWREIVNGEVCLNDWGEIVASEWLGTPLVRPETELDAFVVMPNHVHTIVWVRQEPCGGRMPCAPTGSARTGGRLARPPRSLGALIGGYKAAVTRRIRALRGRSDLMVWQRNYYEHVVRNERELSALREYIARNPEHWARDEENPRETGETDTALPL